MSNFAWLIEAPGPRYLSVRQLSSNPPDFFWTTHADKALRFWSKEQADLTASGVRALKPDLWGFALTLGEAWPREHGWIEETNPADRQPARLCRRPEGCVCGGDTPGVRAGCQHWSA